METLPGKAAFEYLADRAASVGERRVAHRHTEFHAEDLRVEPVHASSGWTPPMHSGVGAQLVDVSDTGIGLKVFSPLLNNTDVRVGVNLYREGSGEELKAQARVIHCLMDDDNLYRVGLAFWEIDRRALDSGYIPDLDS